MRIILFLFLSFFSITSFAVGVLNFNSYSIAPDLTKTAIQYHNSGVAAALNPRKVIGGLLSSEKTEVNEDGTDESEETEKSLGLIWAEPHQNGLVTELIAEKSKGEEKELNP